MSVDIFLMILIHFLHSSLPAENKPDKSSKPQQTNKWRKATGKGKQVRKTFLGKMRANSVIVLSGDDNEDVK